MTDIVIRVCRNLPGPDISIGKFSAKSVLFSVEFAQMLVGRAASSAVQIRLFGQGVLLFGLGRN
jgi:hypothetical protein